MLEKQSQREEVSYCLEDEQVTVSLSDGLTRIGLIGKKIFFFFLTGKLLCCWLIRKKKNEGKGNNKEFFFVIFRTKIFSFQVNSAKIFIILEE